MITVSAPGKLMLLGEHAVVYGYPCLVTAVNKRLTVTMEQTNDGKVVIDAPQSPDTRFVEEAIKQGTAAWGIRHHGLRIATTSELGNYGLGSSAAATVATLKALAVLFQKDVSDRELFELGRQVVIAVQGNGSGFDVAAAVWGGAVYFAEGGNIIEPIEAEDLPLMIAYSGVKADTTSLIAAVAEKKKQYPERVERIFTGIGKLVEQGKDALISHNWERFGKFMDFNQEYLRDLGVSTQKLEDLIRAAKNAGAMGAKLSGAGGGDCVIVLASSVKCQASRKAIEQAGGEVLEVMPNAQGVRVETGEKKPFEILEKRNVPMKATAVAPANIAFIKYWGKKDDNLRLPLNLSISMNLSEAYTTTTVEFSSGIDMDTIEGPFTEREVQRMVNHLDRIRKIANSTLRAKVMTKNSFPKGAGIASSASGFAALTVAATAALGLKPSEKELSILARLGSGSACRSIPDGFVLWEEGPPVGGSSETSYAHSLYPSDWWDLRDIVVVVASQPKDIGSTSGMENVLTSPLLDARLAAIPRRIARVKKALEQKDIHMLGEVIEEDCLDMHAVMQSQKPSLNYWTDETKQIMDSVRQWRKGGLAVYFTIDAGPNVHLICEGKVEKDVLARLEKTQGIKQIIVNKSVKGAHII